MNRQKHFRQEDGQERPLPPPTPKIPAANRVLKDLSRLRKTATTTNEWLSYIFWSLTFIFIMLLGILIRLFTD